MDGIWEFSNFTRLHGTGHGTRISRDLPKLQGTGLPGAGSGSRTFPHDQFVRERDVPISTESGDCPVSRRISRDFHNGEIHEESPNKSRTRTCKRCLWRCRHGTALGLYSERCRQPLLSSSLSCTRRVWTILRAVHVCQP